MCAHILRIQKNVPTRACRHIHRCPSPVEVSFDRCVYCVMDLVIFSSTCSRILPSRLGHMALPLVCKHGPGMAVSHSVNIRPYFTCSKRCISHCLGLVPPHTRYKGFAYPVCCTFGDGSILNVIKHQTICLFYLTGWHLMFRMCQVSCRLMWLVTQTRERGVPD